VEVRQQGMKKEAIAHQRGLSDRTVQRWLAAETFPEAKKRRKRQRSFDNVAPYVLKRWQEGERNGLALWREIKAQGYTGTANGVYRRLETLKQAEVSVSVHPERLQKYSANTAIWLFVRDPEKLDEIEREDLAAFCQASAALKKTYDLLQDFLSLVHKREGKRLDAWLAKVAESGLPELQSFAAGVEKDRDAVQAGLTWPTNNGMVEGHITKFKRIKRTMYGSAGFALLRQRVLHAMERFHLLSPVHPSAGWRRLLKVNYLHPPRLLYSYRVSAPLLSQLADRCLGGPVALDFHQVQDHRMMHNAVDGR
jgi:transposase